MNIKYLLLICLPLLVCSEVFQLNDTNFDQTISSHKFIMVKFYAPWCGHCKKMKQDYIKLAELTKDNDVLIAQYNADQHKVNAQKYGIQGFPTMKFFIDGTPVDYKGQRTVKPMFEWIQRVSQVKVQEINEQKVKELKGANDFVVYYGSNATKIKVIQLAQIMSQKTKYYVVPSETLDKVVFYQKQGQQSEFNQQFQQEVLSRWVMISTLPVVVPLNSKQALDYVFYQKDKNSEVIMLLREQLTDQTFALVQNFCQAQASKYKCCVIDSSMEVYGGVSNYLGSKGKNTLALIRDGLQKAFIFNHPINQFSQQLWNTFLQEVEQKKIPNAAEPKDKKIKYEHVLSLTDQTFNKTIQQNKFIFIEFYSPGCTHCIDFAPTYDEMAKGLKQNKSQIVLAAVDMKQQGLIAQQSNIKSYPTFRLYLSGVQIPYEGPRSLEAITTFIQTAKTSKLILAGSIAQVPSPAVIVYDSAEVSVLSHLPALFSRYPIYQIKQGDTVKIVLNLQQQATFNGTVKLTEVAAWLDKQTEPVLVNLLNPNMDSKLVEALQTKQPIICLVNNQPELSQSLLKTLQEFCKLNSIVCGYATNGDDHFDDFVAWLGIAQTASSYLLLINTTNFDKYMFDKEIQELSSETLQIFIQKILEGKIQKVISEEAHTHQEHEHDHSHEGHDHSHEGHDHSHEGHDHSHEGHDHSHDGHDHSHQGHDHSHQGHDHSHEGHQHHHHVEQQAKQQESSSSSSEAKNDQL